MANRYNETNVIRSLSRKKGSISINPYNRMIEISKDAEDVGIHSWGKIDYLVNYCGYVYTFVKKFTSKPKGVITIDKEIENESATAKRERKFNKFNMAKMAKKAMKANKR